ncbi:AtpZ/AtpI family protein [Mesorhizobium sp. CAU 1741]|uniref:AtpZ/AtpI family protein n=1 Tax=Mesorhizobium sp. CAU 1741 TaxID=3140366 RepID=UPI00325B4248
MPSGPESRQDDLARRSQELEAKLAARRPARSEEDKGSGAGGAVGYGQALKLSSEFIAGIAVGVGIGWLIDTMAGTSPWGLIIFLLLGFVAGVLNVLRSAGMIAQPGSPSAQDRADGPDRN